MKKKNKNIKKEKEKIEKSIIINKQSVKFDNEFKRLISLKSKSDKYSILVKKVNDFEEENKANLTNLQKNNLKELRNNISIEYFKKVKKS